MLISDFSKLKEAITALNHFLVYHCSETKNASENWKRWSGAAGSRTRVQTRKPVGFYMLISS